MTFPERPNRWLDAHAANVTSASGEDGIVEKALELLPARDRWCVEFGAWDGRRASNTYNLVSNRAYSAVLIEPDPERFAQLLETHAGNERVIALRRRVGFGPEDGLDAILAETPIPVDFDVLSIDIDGCDYHVWNAVRRYRPKIVLVEFNPTIPTPVEFVQEASLDVAQGSSLSSLALLGRAKDYELVAVTHTNAIFVERRYFPAFGIADNSPQALRRTDEHVTYLFHGYDGTVFLSGARRLLWHGLPLAEAQMQRLPRRFRRHPLVLGPVGWRLYAAYNRLWSLRYLRGS